MSTRAISGTRRALKELVDGTVRVQIDIDPECRRDFFRLFPEIDTRVAIAPLLGSAQAQETTAPPKGGELAKLAGIFCSDPKFQAWLGVSSEDEAAEAVRAACGIASRAELDHNPDASLIFHQQFRKPWANLHRG